MAVSAIDSETAALTCSALAMATPPPSIFSPEGAIDLHVSPELRASLRSIIDDEKPKRLVVDLSRVPYIDSSGIAVLIGAMQSLEHEGGTFLIAGAQDGVRMIFESARLDQYFRLFPDVDAAVAAP
jgi:anti-sigma B factor antagonist